MITYLLRRSVQGMLVLVLSSFMIYSILTLTPGGPLSQLNFQCGGTGHCPTESDRCRLAMALKLDKPWPVNYFYWLFDPRETTRLDENNAVVPNGIDLAFPDLVIGNFKLSRLFAGNATPDRCEALLGITPKVTPDDGKVHIQGSGVLTGDFGNSMLIQRGRPAASMIGERLGNTMALMLTSLLLSLLLAFPIGIISALKQYSKLDYAVTTFSFVGWAMPSFWLGLMLIVLFAMIPRQLHDSGWTWLPYLPTGNIADLDKEDDLLNHIYHLILPVMVLTLINVAGWSRFIRGSMLEVLRQDYVRTAWAKGLRMRAVITRHALRKALILVITILALSLPGLIQGALVTEAVFAYSGLGRLFLDAVTRLDFPVAMLFLMIVTLLTVICKLLSDVVYAIVDPRIKYT